MCKEYQIDVSFIVKKEFTVGIILGHFPFSTCGVAEIPETLCRKFSNFCLFRGDKRILVFIMVVYEIIFGSINKQLIQATQK